MAKYTPSTIASGYNSTTELNNEFTTIANELNSKVLYRDNPTGEPNQMENDLDMNSNDILNCASLDVDEFSIGGIAATVTAFEGTNIVKFYGTIANMVAATDLTVGDVAQTKGYTTQGDNGDAVYRIVAAATGTDDGGSYHDLSGISGQAELLYSGKTNVRQFGVTGNGTTDDTTKIQAAIDFVESLGGGIVYLPFGRYVVSTTLTVQVSNIQLVGDGWDSVIISKVLTAIPTITFGDAVSTFLGMGIRDLRVTGEWVDGTFVNGGSSETYLVKANECTEFKMVNCKINLSANSGVHLSGCENPTVTRSSFRDNLDKGLYQSKSDDLNHTGPLSRIYANMFKDNGNYGIHLTTGSGHYIWGNVIESHDVGAGVGILCEPSNCEICTTIGDLSLAIRFFAPDGLSATT